MNFFLKIILRQPDYWLLLFLCFGLNAQEFNPEVLELPDSITAKDFSFLKRELKNVQVVMLGENTHYDGNALKTKTEIIKFLHHEMGFNTLAFESGVYDVWKAQQEIQKGEDASYAFKNSLYDFWIEKEEFQSFVDYYKFNKNQLKLYGYDSRITGEYGRKFLLMELYYYCRKNNISFTMNKNDLGLLLETFSSSFLFDEIIIPYPEFEKAFTKLLNQILEKPRTEERFYWINIVKNILALGKENYTLKSVESKMIDSVAHIEPVKENQFFFYANASDNIRDKQMADNLLSYLKRNPSEKIICWGASGHFTNDMSSVDYPIIKDFIPMGSYVKKELNEKAYSLAMINASFQLNNGESWYQTSLDTTSFEYYLGKKAKQHLFISTKQKSIQVQKSNRFFSDTNFIKARLDLLHDGYLFFNNVSESTTITQNSSKRKSELKKYIVDEDTGEAIPNANLFIKGDSFETISSKDGSLILKNENKKQVKNIVISALGYETRTLYLAMEEVPEEITLKRLVTNLDEIVLEEEISPYYIIKKVIQRINKNYPTRPFNAEHYANYKIQIQDSVVFDLDFVTDLYHTNYLKGIRSTQNIKHVRWNVGEIEEPTRLHDPFLVRTYQMSINYKPFLEKSKYQKFKFVIKDRKKINGEIIYVIDFETDKKNFAFTKTYNPSKYHGTLFVNREDFAIIKLTEYWDYLPKEENQSSIENEGFWKNNFVNRTLNVGKRESFFSKAIDGKYYLKKSKSTIKGFVEDNNNLALDFKDIFTSFWFNIKTKNVTPINFKEEKNRINKIRYVHEFWKEFNSNTYLNSF